MSSCPESLLKDERRQNQRKNGDSIGGGEFSWTVTPTDGPQGYSRDFLTYGAKEFRAPLAPWKGWPESGKGSLQLSPTDSVQDGLDGNLGEAYLAKFLTFF